MLCARLSLPPPPPVPLWLTLQSTHPAGPPIIIWTEWQHSVSLSPPTVYSIICLVVVVVVGLYQTLYTFECRYETGPRELFEF